MASILAADNLHDLATCAAAAFRGLTTAREPDGPLGRVDMTHLEHGTTAGFDITADLLHAIRLGLPCEISAYSFESTALANAVKNDGGSLKCIVSSKCIVRDTFEKIVLRAEGGGVHTKKLKVWSGTPAWHAMRANLTHAQIIAHARGLDKPGRRALLGSIILLRGGSCNYSSFDRNRSAHDVSSWYRPQSEAQVGAAQPALEELDALYANPPFSEISISAAEMFAGTSCEAPPEWASLPTEVVHPTRPGERLKLHMVIDNALSLGGQGLSDRDGSGYVGVKCLYERGGAGGVQHGELTGYALRFHVRHAELQAQQATFRFAPYANGSPAPYDSREAARLAAATKYALGMERLDRAVRCPGGMRSGDHALTSGGIEAVPFSKLAAGVLPTGTKRATRAPSQISWAEQPFQQKRR